jgi:hypothetical protein
MHPAVGAGVDGTGSGEPAAVAADVRHPRKSTSDGWIARESAPRVAL